MDECKKICKHCWNTDTFSKCSRCDKRFESPSDVSLIDNNDKFVCKSCDNRIVPCCVCKKLVEFTICARKEIGKDAWKYICYDCASNPEKFCEMCWKPTSKHPVERGYYTVSNLCEDCAQFYSECIVSIRR